MSDPGFIASSLDGKQASSGPLAGDELHLYLCELCCFHVPGESFGHHTSAPGMCWSSLPSTKPSGFGDEATLPCSPLPFFQWTFICLHLSCRYSAPVAQRDSEQSERNSRGKCPSHLPFQLQAAWGSVSTCSRCVETKAISSS